MQNVSTTSLVWHYGRPALFFHWVLAALVPFQLGLGWYMLSIEDTPGSAVYFALHISVGLTAALLIALRLMWRLSHRPAHLPSTLPPWQVKLAGLTHVLFYVLLLLMPLTGYLGAAFGGEPAGFFGLTLPGWAARDDGLKELFFTAHSFLAWALVALIVVHVLGALKHLIIDNDGVFARMWPH